MTWYVRRASLRDRDALVKLCRATMGPDDYVIDYLDDLILRGVVHIALGPKERVVGMMSYTPCIDGSAWLGQARTHPDFRRQGVARALVDSFVGVARAGNVPVLRLWSEATNQEGIATFTATGFREVARFSRVVASAARGPPKSAPLRFDESLCRAVTSSPVVAKGRGYVHHDGYFVPASRPVVFALASLGLFRGWEGNLLSLERSSAARRETFEFTFWSGDPESVLPEACRLAAQAGKANVATFVPRHRDLLAASRREGFQVGSWAREAIVSELPIAPSNLRKRMRPTYGELAAKRGHGHAPDGLGWARWNP